MQIQLSKTDIIKKFKRSGYNLNSASLQIVTEYLTPTGNQSKFLDTLIKKIDQVSISSTEKFDQKIVKIAIQILQQGGQSKLRTYEQIIQDVRKWSTMYISPYQISQQTFFKEKPQPYLFEFGAMDKTNNDLQRFKQVQSYTKQHDKKSQFHVGMLYQNFDDPSKHTGKPKLFLQTQASQIQIIFPKQYEHKQYLIPGCIYAVKGSYLTKTLALTVQELRLPLAIPEEKVCLLKRKFKLMCQNINTSKSGLDFKAHDFLKYTTIYNEQRDPNKPIMIFGVVRICKQTVQRMLRICSQFNKRIQCIIIMLDQGEHQQINLKIWFQGITVYMIPHINSQGPRLLPKIPILKTNFNATVLTNPAKFSIHGREAMFINQPLVKSINDKNIVFKEQNQVNQNKMAKSISELLFSQGNISICNQIYPKQHEYFKIRQETVLFLSDKACPNLEYSKDKQGKKCLFVSVGNFQRDGDFLCYIPKAKKPIQFCQQPK